MKDRGNPKVSKNSGKSHTKISWIADFVRFGLDGYSKEMYQLMERRLYDIAGVTDKQVNVYYNGKMIKQKSFDKYIGKSPNYCFIDVGGGSTEVIVYKDFKFY